MCGVCGVVRGVGALREADQARVAAMLGALIHRGPDDTGMRRAPAAVLGATRLAIRGMGDGHQPISDTETGVLAVVNGEIDNHLELRARLAARGRHVVMSADVAVVPPLYLEFGVDFVKELVGAFALAVYDPRHDRLILARDHAGERPLFYVRSPDGVTFATELSALTADRSLDLGVDPAAIAGYLQYGSFTAPAAPFRGVRKLAPAQRIVFEGDTEHQERYWRWPMGQTTKIVPTPSAFDVIFRRAVHRQTENDFPFGVFLSGGIDSSLVAAVARVVRPEARLSAFTLRFQEASYDEGDSASAVASYLGLNSVPVWVQAEDFPTEVRRLISMVGEPLADPAWIPTALLARRAAEEVKIALGGEGADELFGGYPTYIGALVSGHYARLPGWLKASIRKLVVAWPHSDKKVTTSFLLKRFVAGGDMDWMERHLLWTSSIPPDVLRRLGVEPRTREPERLESILDSVQRHDLETSLAEGLLTKADRASMSSSLELRAPFLDRDVMMFAASLPESERVHALTTKVFLKRYALRYLPREFVTRKKRGLSVPLARWLRENLHDWAAERLGDSRLREAGVDPRAALDILAEHRDRRANHARPIWTLAVLAEWLQWAEGSRSECVGAEGSESRLDAVRVGGGGTTVYSQPQCESSSSKTTNPPGP